MRAFSLGAAVTSTTANIACTVYSNCRQFPPAFYFPRGHACVSYRAVAGVGVAVRLRSK